MARYEHAILNTARWESETIVEWVEYYREIGFDHIYTYCNDDDPTDMYAKLRPFIECETPFVTFRFMPYQGQQPACWMHFFQNHLDECDWFMFADADEFLVLKPHNSIKHFMSERTDKYDCIHFNWIWFGPEHFDVRPPGSTLLQYMHREDEAIGMNYFTKTLNRSKSIDSSLIGRPPVDMMNHRWPATISASLREVNVLGESMVDFFSDFPKSAEAFMSDPGRRRQIVESACLYHYLFRSKADFQRRVNRGTLGAYYFQPIWGRLAENPNEMADLLGKLGQKEDVYLRDFWQARCSALTARALATSIAPRAPVAENMARRSSPTQSSLSPWSRGRTPEEDAAGATSGVITGGDGFHTNIEERPWWMTDLGSVRGITEVRVFNSLKNPGMAARAYPLTIEVSDDQANWAVVFQNAGNSPFGGADGHPLVVRVQREARFVRLRLQTTDFFHLDEVEIYG